MALQGDEDKYATPFSRVAQRMFDDETTVGENDDERNERLRRTFMHKFVHSKDVEPRARELIKRITRSDNSHVPDSNTNTGNEHDERLVSTTVFNVVESDDSASDGENDYEKRVFRGTFELETELPDSTSKKSAKKASNTTKSRFLFGHDKSDVPSTERAGPRSLTSQPDSQVSPLNTATADRQINSPSRSNVSTGARPVSSASVSNNKWKKSTGLAANSNQQSQSKFGSQAALRRAAIETLEPERVRWFYRDAAGKKWTPFCGYDSLRLECKYRELTATLGSTGPEKSEVKKSLKKKTARQRPTQQSQHASDPLNATKQKEIHPAAKSNNFEMKPMVDDFNITDGKNDRTESVSSSATLSASTEAQEEVQVQEQPTQTVQNQVEDTAQEQPEHSAQSHTLYASVEETDADERASLIGAAYPADLASEIGTESSDSESEGDGQSNVKTDRRSGLADDSEPIIVRGGLYEVHVGARTCRPIYWHTVESHCGVMRGSWFVASSGEALEEAVSDVLEAEHIRAFERFAQNAGDKDSSSLLNLLKDASARFGASFNRDGTSGTKKDGDTSQGQHAGLFAFNRPMHEVAFRNLMIEWYSFDDVVMYEDSGLLVTMLPKLGFRQRSGGTKLRRGYAEPSVIDDKPPDISHLVFVIHGIGQKAYSGAIVKCCDRLRANAAKLIGEYYPAMARASERVEFVPVEWRNALKLDGDTVASVTPPHMSNIRTMLNSTAMDILYYTSPLYRAELTAGLKHELLRLYTMFCARNPYFEQRGQVSVIAHSLGAVMFYDILTGWNPVHLYKQTLSKGRNNRSPSRTGLASRHASYMSLNTASNRMSPAGSPLVTAPGSGGLTLGRWAADSEVDDLDEMTAESEERSQIREFDSLMLELDDARKRVNVLEARLLSIAERQHLLSTESDFVDSPSAESNSNPAARTQRVIFPKNCVAGCYWKQLPKIANFFCLGSPLSVFLALRGVRPRGRRTYDEVFPPNLVHRVYNIYHPCDPIAYRLEPLLLKHYATIKPLYIHAYYDALQRIVYAQMPIVLMNPNAANSSGEYTHSTSNSASTSGSSATVASSKPNTSTNNSNGNANGKPGQSEAADGAKEGIRRSGMGNFFTQTDDKRLLTSEEAEKRAQSFSTELKAFRTTRSSSNLRSHASSLALDFSLRSTGTTSAAGWDDDTAVACTCRYDTDRVGLPMQLRRAGGCPQHGPIGPPTTSAPLSPASSTATTSLLSNGVSGLVNADIIDSIDYSNVEAADLEYRLDYEVKDSELSIYLAILRAHTSYWRNLDVLQFILQHIFPKQAHQAALAKQKK